jgi:arylsulfatase A-like enzyme
VPLIVRLPGAASGGMRVSDPVSLVDVPATVLELLGVEAPAGRDGRSLLPALRREALERDAPLVAQLERDKQGRAFLLERWPLRLIETAQDYAGRSDVLELFDHATDPSEQIDLAPRDPARTSELREALRRRRAALEAHAFRAEATELDEAQRRRLDELGYGK